MSNQQKLIKEIFEKELSMCRKLSKENGGKCNWGKCENCGVIPLLYNIYGGKLIEDKEEVKNIKDKILKGESWEK